MNVLLLEDDRDSREALAALLALDNYTVRQAEDASGFHAATAALDVDAVIFDLRLADECEVVNLVMDYQRRRTESGRAAARLICLSGSAVADPVGPTPFPIARRLRKPADYDAVLSALRSRAPA